MIYPSPLFYKNQILAAIHLFSPMYCAWTRPYPVFFFEDASAKITVLEVLPKELLFGGGGGLKVILPPFLK